MNNNTEYNDSLRKLLEIKRKELEETSLNKFATVYNKFYSSFSSLFRMLCDENIIKDDPYKQDYELKKLSLPDNTPIAYNEEEYQITIRLSHYEALLTYIKSNIQFDLDFFTPTNIQIQKSLLKFIDWDMLFHPQPKGENTAALNKILFLYQKDIGHTYVISTLKSSTKNIDIYSQELMTILNDLELISNENYKLNLRDSVLTKIKLPPVIKGENIKKAHDLISKKVKESGLPIHINLIGELLKEDFSSEGDQLKKNIFDRLTTEGKTTQHTKKEKKASTKDILSNSLTELYKFSSQINSILLKVDENSVLHRDMTYSFIDKLIDYIKHSIFLNKRETKYKLVVTNDTDGSNKDKIIELEKFTTSLNSLHKTLECYKNSDQESFKELFNKSEDDIQIFVHQLISKCRHKHKMLSALDQFFKKEATGTKGIQVELKAMKLVLTRSQVLYQEFQKLKEENQKDLLKRGVKP